MVDMVNQYKVEEVDKEYVHSIKIMTKLPEQKSEQNLKFEQQFVRIFNGKTVL